MKTLILFGNRQAMLYSFRGAVKSKSPTVSVTDNHIRTEDSSVRFFVIERREDLLRLAGERFDLVVFDDSYYRFADTTGVHEWFLTRVTR